MIEYLGAVLRFYRDLLLLPYRVVRNEFASMKSMLEEFSDDDPLATCDCDRRV